MHIHAYIHMYIHTFIYIHIHANTHNQHTGVAALHAPRHFVHFTVRHYVPLAQGVFGREVLREQRKRLCSWLCACMHVVVCVYACGCVRVCMWLCACMHVVVCVYALRIREAERERRRALREGGRDCAREREGIQSKFVFKRPGEAQTRIFPCQSLHTDRPYPRQSVQINMHTHTNTRVRVRVRAHTHRQCPNTDRQYPR